MRKLLVLLTLATLTMPPLAARPPEDAVFTEVVVGLVGSFAGMYAGWTVSELLTDSFPDNLMLGRQLRMVSILGGSLSGRVGASRSRGRSSA